MNENVERPSNFSVYDELDAGVQLTKKNLYLVNNGSTWLKMSPKYQDHYKIYTDASKIENGTGIGIADLCTTHFSIGITKEMQITNAEMVAILKGIIVASEGMLFSLIR